MKFKLTHYHLLGVNSAKLEGARHAVDGQHIRRDAVVDLVRLRVTNHFIEPVFHNIEEAFVDFAFAPEEALTVLDPFEIADRHPARITENVRNREDAFGVNDGVRLPRGGAVRAFAKNSGLYLIRIFLSNLIFDRRWNRDVARLEQHIPRTHLCAPVRKILERSFLRVDPIDDFGDVKTIFVVEAAADIGKTNNFVTRLLHQVRSQRPDVAETLDNDTAPFFPNTKLC